jgi:hypothetical protein
VITGEELELMFGIGSKDVEIISFFDKSDSGHMGISLGFG